MDEEPEAADVSHLHYRLRSTFFLRKLREYKTLSLPLMVAELLSAEHLYSWERRADWEIGESAFTYISRHHHLKLLQVFCHPRVLREYPRLVAYYRNIAALSQKASLRLARIDVAKFEGDTDNERRLNEEQALALAKLFNEHITLIVESTVESLTKEDLHGILLASTGAQIDGSWRNASAKKQSGLFVGF